MLKEEKSKDLVTSLSDMNSDDYESSDEDNSGTEETYGKEETDQLKIVGGKNSIRRVAKLRVSTDQLLLELAFFITINQSS